MWNNSQNKHHAETIEILGTIKGMTESIDETP